MRKLATCLALGSLVLVCALSAHAELVGYWSFDDGAGATLTDQTHYGGDGQLKGSTLPSWTGGHTGGASDYSLNFPGSGGAHVLLGNLPQLKITKDQTISMWLTPTAFGSRQNPYAKAYGGSGTITQETNGVLTYYYGTSGKNASPYDQFRTVTKLNLNAWNHIAIVRDLTGDQLRWYVNGTRETMPEDPNFDPAVAGNLPAYFGRGYAGYYKGSIDDAAIWNEALSDLEVRGLGTGQRSPGQYQWAPDDWLKGWFCRQAITIQNPTSANLTDFPVPIEITDPTHCVFRNAQPNGHDILFTTADGRTLLPHEIERFNNAPGSEELVAWVKTPLSAAEDTTLYMYYYGPDLGDQSSTDTWNSNFKMVQHLNETTAGVHYDSTANGNDATVTNADMNGSGKIDGADAFDGSGDYLDLPYGAGIDPSTSPHTFSMWVKSGDLTAQDIFFSSGQVPDNNARMYLGHTGGDWEMGIQGSPWGAGTTDVTTDWTHLVLVMDGTTATLYVNGGPDHQKSYTSYTLNTNIDVARHPSSPGFYDFTGSMDEIRISDTARTAEWIFATYRLIAASEDYFTFDDPVCIPEPTTMTLLGLGALGLVARLRRRRR